MHQKNDKQNAKLTVACNFVLAF